MLNKFAQPDTHDTRHKTQPDTNRHKQAQTGTNMYKQEYNRQNIGLDRHK
jgi:hypothetical protein